MLRRPLTLWLIGIGLLLTPLYYYFEHALYGGVPWHRPLEVLGGIPYLKLGAAAFAVPVGALVLMVRPAGFYGILGYALYTGSVNAFYFFEQQIAAPLFVLFLPTGFFLVLYFARREIMSPFFNPRLRRWEIDRIRCRAPAELRLDGETVSANTWDIGSSGIYLELDRELAPGTRILLALRLGEAPPVAAEAEVVWSSAGIGDRPRGVGVKLSAASARAVTARLNEVDARAAPRLPFKLKADIVGHESVECETFDISHTGCFLVTDRTFTVGETLRMTFHLERPIDVEGQVVRVSSAPQSPRGIGVRFDRASSQLRAAIRELHSRS